MDAKILNHVNSFNFVLTVNGDEVFYLIKGKVTKQKNNCNMKKCPMNT